MVNTEKFVSLLKKKKINFICGVPDSCVNNFVNSIKNHKVKHMIAPNEGSAVALGIGNYLKTKKNSTYIYAKFWHWKCRRSHYKFILF